MYNVLEIIIPIITLLFIGLLLRKNKILSTEAIRGFKALVVNVMLPVLLFMTFSTNKYSFHDLLAPAILFFVCGIMLFIGLVLSNYLNLPGVSGFFASCFEVGMLGYALIVLLYGEKSVAKLALVDFGHVVFVFTIYTTLINRQSGKKLSLHESIKNMLKSPVLIAVILGIIFSLTGLGALIYSKKFGGILKATMQSISAPLGAIILMVIGYEVDLSNIKIDYTLKLLIIRLISSIFGLIIAYLCFGIFKINDPFLTKAMVFMFILPPPFILPIFSSEKNSAALASAVSVSTILSIIIYFGFVLTL